MGSFFTFFLFSIYWVKDLNGFRGLAFGSGYEAIDGVLLIAHHCRKERMFFSRMDFSLLQIWGLLPTKEWSSNAVSRVFFYG